MIDSSAALAFKETSVAEEAVQSSGAFECRKPCFSNSALRRQPSTAESLSVNIVEAAEITGSTLIIQFEYYDIVESWGRNSLDLGKQSLRHSNIANFPASITEVSLHNNVTELSFMSQTGNFADSAIMHRSVEDSRRHAHIGLDDSTFMSATFMNHRSSRRGELLDKFREMRAVLAKLSCASLNVNSVASLPFILPRASANIQSTDSLQIYRQSPNLNQQDHLVTFAQSFPQQHTCVDSWAAFHRFLRPYLQVIFRYQNRQNFECFFCVCSFEVES